MCKISCFNRKTYPSSSSIIIKSCHRTGCLAYSRGCSTVWTLGQHHWQSASELRASGKPPASMWLVLLLRHLWDQPWCAQLTDDAALFKESSVIQTTTCDSDQTLLNRTADSTYKYSPKFVFPQIWKYTFLCFPTNRLYLGVLPGI